MQNGIRIIKTGMEREIELWIHEALVAEQVCD